MIIDLKNGQTLRSRMERRGFTCLPVLFYVRSSPYTTPRAVEYGTVYEKEGKYWRASKHFNIRQSYRFELYEIQRGDFELQ